MKAAVYQRYGSPDVLRINEIPMPVPGGDEILVRNHATTVGATDSVARQGVPRYARPQPPSPMRTGMSTPDTRRAMSSSQPADRPGRGSNW
jgi:NADPH:quinone reductase-like Zn-dependent oxidoreductase